MQELEQINNLLDPTRLEILESSFQEVISSFKAPASALLSMIHQEFTLHTKSKLYLEHERRYLREKLQSLLYQTGNKRIIQAERQACSKLIQNINHELFDQDLMRKKTSEDNVKFLRLVGEIFEDKLRKITDEIEYASFKNSGRWKFIVNYLTEKLKTRPNQYLENILQQMNQNPSKYRCFFLGINNMDFDQIDDEELIRMKTKIDNLRVQIRSDKASLVDVQRSIDEFEMKVADIDERIEETKIVTEVLRTRSERIRREIE